MELNIAINAEKICPNTLSQIFTEKRDGRNRALGFASKFVDRPKCLKIGLQNISFSIDFIELRHNSSLICNFP